MCTTCTRTVRPSFRKVAWGGGEVKSQQFCGGDRTYGYESVGKAAETLLGEETIKKAMISKDTHTEWKTYIYLRFLAKQPKDNMKLQLGELASKEMLKTMFPNLSRVATISLSIPVATASVERSFSQMKLIKTHLQSCLSDANLSHLLLNHQTR